MVDFVFQILQTCMGMETERKTMKLKVVQMRPDTVDGKPIIHLWGRTDEGERMHLKLHHFKPYFYVDQEPYSHPSISNVRQSGVNLLNEPLWRVEVDLPQDVPVVRKNYPIHYEADVLFIDRARYDLGIKSIIEIPDDFGFGDKIGPEDITSSEGDIPMRYWNIDIETSDKDGFADPKYPTGEVLSFVIYDSYDKILHACITRKVDKEKVRRLLKDKKWLKKHIKTDNDVPPCDIPIKIYCVKDELRLYMKLYQLFKRLKPDIIIGWNSINYDVPYLKERAKNRTRKYSCPNFKEINELDLMESYKKLYKAKVGELLSKSLEFCGITELGYGKLKHDEGFYELYENDTEKFLAYNIWDTVLSERVNDAQDVLFYFQKMAEMAGTGLNNVHYSSQLFDALVLHRLNGIVVLPTRAILDGTGIRGGYVHEPSSGIHHWVCTIDFKQQYPSAIRSLNMSPETVITGKAKKGSYFMAPSGTKYLKEPRGLLPMILDELSIERDIKKAEMKMYPIGSRKYKAKDAEQTAFKFFMNSLYGLMATAKAIFRLTNNTVGYDIPDTAKWFTKGTIGWCKELGLNVVYGDTDSCLIQFPDIDDANEVEKFLLEFVKNVNKKYDEMIKELKNTGEPHHFNIEAEIIYEKYFQSARLNSKGELVGKKRYAGLIAWKDGVWLLDKPAEERMVVKGYEVRRSNAARLTRDLQEEILLMILDDYSMQDIRDKIRTTIEEVRNGQHSELLGIPTGIGQESYDRKPAFVRAYEFSNAYLGHSFKYGDKPIWFYGYIKDKPTTDVFAIDYGDKIPDDAVIDIERMIERCIIGPLDAIVQGLGYSWSELIEGDRITKQRTLFADK